MKTLTLNNFLKTNEIDYSSLPYSGEHEAVRDLSHKRKWGRQGKAALKELAQSLGANATLNVNPSGDIDRGYVYGFFVKNTKDSIKCVYISISDGSKSILWRTAKDTSDFTGGRNNNSDISQDGFDQLREWLKQEFV